MNKRYIKSVATEGPYGEMDKETLKGLRVGFPTLFSRRLSVSSLLIGHVLSECVFQADDELIFLSTYAAANNLEKYLASFPEASPFYFQCSIHPGALEMITVFKQLPLSSVLPLCGYADLAGRGLFTALLSEAPQVYLVGGEERAGWLTQEGFGSQSSYAYQLCLSREDAGALGELSFVEALDDSATRSASGEVLHECLKNKESALFGLPEVGGVRLEWYE